MVDGRSLCKQQRLFKSGYLLCYFKSLRDVRVRVKSIKKDFEKGKQQQQQQQYSSIHFNILFVLYISKLNSKILK